MPPVNPTSRAFRFFYALGGHPRVIVGLGAAWILAVLTQIPSLELDVRSESFLPANDPVIHQRDQVRSTFELQDPMVIAIVSPRPGGIFTAQGLSLVQWVTDRVRDVDGVNPRRVESIATEDAILGTGDHIDIAPFFEDPPTTQTEADAIWREVANYPLALGRLVSRDGDAAFVVAELLGTERDVASVYEELRSIAAEAPTDDEELFVGGEGAVTGYLVRYVDSDARRLIPFAFVVICVVLAIAYRTPRGVVLPMLVVVAALGTALGGMAFTGVPFFVVTNGMAVILIGIAVADGLHILGEYYGQANADPNAEARVVVARALDAVWRPVLITSVTTAAGFLALAWSSYMPPMKFLGIFSAAGTAAAFLFSTTVLPACLTLLAVRGCRVHRAATTGEADRFGRAMAHLGEAVESHPRVPLAIALAVAALAGLGALRLEVDEEWIRNFRSDEPIVAADRVLNRVSDGTAILDVVFEAPPTESILTPRRLQTMDAFQSWAATLPTAHGATSIVDIVKELNRVFHGGEAAAYSLPDAPDMIAQYLLAYEAFGDPENLRRYLSYGQRRANVRVQLRSGRYRDQRRVAEEVDRYFSGLIEPGIVRALRSGNLSVNVRWMSEIEKNHIRGTSLALIAVLVISCLAFRSVVAGVLSVLPVLLSILVVYGIMGWFDVWLGIGTSMFAAIAIGVGIDFAVHVIEKLRTESGGEALALARFFPTGGRVLLFNFAAVALGFGVLLLSQVPPLVRFGALVGTSVSIAFIASVTTVPALLIALRGRTPAPAGTDPECADVSPGALGRFPPISHSGPLRAQQKERPPGE